MVAGRRDVGRSQPEAVGGRRTGVTGDVEAHRQVSQRRDLEVHGITDDGLAGVEQGGRLTAEHQGPIRPRDNRRSVLSASDMGGSNRHGRSAEGVGQADPHASTADAGPHDHANGLVGETRNLDRRGKAARWETLRRRRSRGRVRGHGSRLRRGRRSGRRRGCRSRAGRYRPTSAWAAGEARQLQRGSPRRHPLLTDRRLRARRWSVASAAMARCRPSAGRRPAHPRQPMACRQGPSMASPQHRGGHPPFDSRVAGDPSHPSSPSDCWKDDACRLQQQQERGDQADGDRRGVDVGVAMNEEGP